MKKIICLLFIVMTTLLYACEREEEVIPPVTTAAPTVSVAAIQTVTTYSIDVDSLAIVPVQNPVSKEGELTAERVVKLVTANLNDKEIIIDEIIQRKDTVILSFDKKGKPVKGCTAEMENLILECYANSLLDNAENCRKVIIRASGKKYVSENLAFGYNEVFASE
ncbi:MAG: hypothetical protein K6G62_02870 [Eubacterium sp.]|nr:hypothetical protein [Eubacterium sp.]